MKTLSPKNAKQLSSSEELFQIAAALALQAQEGLKPEINNPIQATASALSKFAKSWSGSWLGYHAYVYYADFNPPPAGAHFSQEWGIEKKFGGYGTMGDWVEYNPDDVKSAIYKEAGNSDLSEVRKLAKKYEPAFKDAKSEVLSILSTEISVKPDEYLSDIKKQVQDLEFLDSNEIIRRMSAGQMWSRDAVAVGQGKKAPPHKKIEAELTMLHNATALLVELENYATKAATHIARKQRPETIPMAINNDLSTNSAGIKEIPDWNVNIIETLARNFHRMALQIKRRYDGRPPFLIKDEYDVQDLMHTFLRGFFDDIRPEEWAPSYAGSASRLDFLLKKEKIVLEMKMASAKLKDKQVGEQLIIDIAKYKKHPDCKHLICFVYDQDNNLKNPVGLETDLSSKEDSLHVTVIVVSPS